MNSLRNEFGKVDFILLIIAGLMILGGFWIASVIVGYLIIRKLDNKKLRVIGYIALALQITTIVFMATSTPIYEWVWTYIVNVFDINSSTFLGITNIFQLSLQLTIYIIIALAFALNSGANKLLRGIFVFNVASFLLITIFFIIFFVFSDYFESLFFYNRIYSITQFEDYLMGSALVILYKDLFFHPKDEEVYETFKETI